MVTHWRNGGNCGSRIQELQDENHMKKQLCWKNNEGMAQNDLPPPQNIHGPVPKMIN